MSRDDRISSGKVAEVLDKSKLVGIAVLVILTPVVLLAITLAFLLTAQGLEFDQLSVVELVELYLIEVAFFALFGYLLYRLLIHSVENHLPEIIDRLEDSEETRPTSTEPWGTAQTERDATRTDADADDDRR